MYEIPSAQEKCFLDAEGNEVPAPFVYFRGNGKPYFLDTDEEGNPVMTKEALEEVEIS